MYKKHRSPIVELYFYILLHSIERNHVKINTDVSGNNRKKTPSV